MSLMREELERSFGDGPGHPPVGPTLVAGRRALRRRRLGSAAGVLAVVVALGTAYAVAAPGGDGARRGQVATDPTSSPTTTLTRDAAPESAPWGKGEILRYNADGALEVRPGVVVHEHLQNPYGYALPKRSDALDLTFEGQRVWAIVELKNTGSTLSTSEPSNGWASFADYVADQVGVAPAGNGWPETLRLSDRGVVVAREGSEILQRTDDPRLGASFAPAGTPTGAALVTAGEDSFTYFVVWRVIDGRLDVITTPARSSQGPGFAELVDHARAQYASGEGLR
ncbi:MAG: hypothetical protein JWR90_3250 [Marmoricola sp.]|nr:hypothetical protein [Marmoricola sp.]